MTSQTLLNPGTTVVVTERSKNGRYSGFQFVSATYPKATLSVSIYAYSCCWCLYMYIEQTNKRTNEQTQQETITNDHGLCYGHNASLVSHVPYVVPVVCRWSWSSRPCIDSSIGLCPLITTDGATNGAFLDVCTSVKGEGTKLEGGGTKFDGGGMFLGWPGPVWKIDERSAAARALAPLMSKTTRSKKDAWNGCIVACLDKKYTTC